MRSGQCSGSEAGRRDRRRGTGIRGRGGGAGGARRRCALHGAQRAAVRRPIPLLRIRRAAALPVKPAGLRLRLVQRGRLERLGVRVGRRSGRVRGRVCGRRHLSARSCAVVHSPIASVHADRSIACRTPARTSCELAVKRKRVAARRAARSGAALDRGARPTQAGACGVPILPGRAAMLRVFARAWSAPSPLDAVPPGRPYDARLSGHVLRFRAPGGDLLCDYRGLASATSRSVPWTRPGTLAYLARSARLVSPNAPADGNGRSTEIARWLR